MALTFLEFFAGGGMARLGLGPGWRCLFANDFDAMKRDVYVANHGAAEFRFGDINGLTASDLPDEPADAAWASFPCQDLSLAGARKGLAGKRSGAFFSFMRVIDDLRRGGRAPRCIVIENVVGLLNSGGGADFTAVARALEQAGYSVGAKIIDARHFAPQSRPRLFVFGFGPTANIDRIADARPDGAPRARRTRVASKYDWIAAEPGYGRNEAFVDIMDWRAPWDPPAKTRALINAMAPRHVDRLRETARGSARTGRREAGCAYRRVRLEEGRKIVRVEPRFDGLSGCLRTPAGGSSRQIVIGIERGEIRSRLMTPIEGARAMGLPDDYRLPDAATAALKVVGDGVAPPVVRWIASAILEPALDAPAPALHTKINEPLEKTHGIRAG